MNFQWNYRDNRKRKLEMRKGSVIWATSALICLPEKQISGDHIYIVLRSFLPLINYNAMFCLGVTSLSSVKTKITIAWLPSAGEHRIPSGALSGTTAPLYVASELVWHNKWAIWAVTTPYQLEALEKVHTNLQGAFSLIAVCTQSPQSWFR